LLRAVTAAGLSVEAVRSWNVLLRPVVALRRKRSSGSDLEHLAAPVNAALRLIIGAERHLPFLGGRRGVSLLVEARRPERREGAAVEPQPAVPAPPQR
jgi:hypothetical protein